MLRVICFLVLLAGAWSAQAMRVDNVVLLDHMGDAQKLYYHKDANAVVFMIQGDGGAIVRNALSDYKALRHEPSRPQFSRYGTSASLSPVNDHPQRTQIAP